MNGFPLMMMGPIYHCAIARGHLGERMNGFPLMMIMKMMGPIYECALARGHL